MICRFKNIRINATAKNDNQKLMVIAESGSSKRTANNAPARIVDGSQFLRLMSPSIDIITINKARWVGSVKPANNAQAVANRTAVIPPAIRTGIFSFKLGKIPHINRIGKKANPATTAICRPDIATKWLVPVCCNFCHCLSCLWW